MSNEKQRLPIDAIQLAVYTRLSTDLATPWPSVGVFSWQVPKGEEYPFVVIGMFSSIPAGMSKDSGGHEVTLAIEAYDQNTSAVRLNSIMNCILTALSRANIAIGDGFEETWGWGRPESSEVLPTWDEANAKVVLQGVIRYKWLIQDTQQVT
jgi:hypothetical protein